MTSFVFGSLPFSNQGGDQIVSKAVSAAIAALFKRTGKLEAKVRAEPVAKLLQGSIDGFDFIGNGMLMYNGLRIEAMELYVQAVSIDFSAIFTGQVKLRQPTQASLRVILTEEDLTTSFNTPFVVEKLQGLQYQDQSLHFQNTQMILNDDKSLRLKTAIRVGEASEPLDVDMTAFLNVEDRSKIQFINVTYQGSEEAQELGKALIDHVNNLMDLDKFALEGTQIKIDRARIKDQQIVFYGVAQINQFPQKKPK
ncbi:DUF2993 domain-containing protein [Aphanothece hegewaldii CCALA 016]|uniref:DUF2993 domain-containing protein n=1 Tax=Aphanothece hegewaldii CCALA 016 TaxID=2107694 RepID=A0A2T1M3B3_9CHRO|nr:DUF2993 domain-containing protein [Aphanothece hegewaldii]PSF39331.1 DUF2993 domain-containing protein [Aphanothece hegewaldii CCALA 016]